MHAANTATWLQSKRVSAAAASRSGDAEDRIKKDTTRAVVVDPPVRVMSRPGSMSGWKAVFAITFADGMVIMFLLTLALFCVSR
jgi:hypothetical protein